MTPTPGVGFPSPGPAPGLLSGEDGEVLVLMDVELERPVRAQLTTARMLLAQFIAQLDEYEAMNRDARRTVRGRDLTKRLDGLKDGREKWAARVAELEARLAAEVTE